MANSPTRPNIYNIYTHCKVYAPYVALHSRKVTGNVALRPSALTGLVGCKRMKLAGISVLFKTLTEQLASI